MWKQMALWACAGLLWAGCSSAPPATTAASATAAPAAGKVETGYALGSKKKGDKGHCAVCVVKEGKPGEEAVAETLDYKGKTYVFCNESEKAEFISEPAKYAGL